jgi:hypothetical protein
VPTLNNSEYGGNRMNYQALWQVVAIVLVILADWVIEKTGKHRREGPEK